MKKLLCACLLFLAVAVTARAQVHLTLDQNAIIKQTALTTANSDNIIDGINANASPGKQFALRLIPGGGSGGGGVLVGTQAGAVHSAWGASEDWNGATAEFTLQGYTGRHGLLVHTTGNQGMAIIGWSSTGAQAGKFVQETHFTSPDLTVYRRGNPASSDASAVMISVPSGNADLLTLHGQLGDSKFDSGAAFHPPHLADSAAAVDSVYFSTTQNKLAYKDPSGVTHPLY